MLPKEKNKRRLCTSLMLIRLLWQLEFLNTQKHNLSAFMQHNLSLKDPAQCYKDQSKIHCIMTHNTSLHTDILAMNVSWLLEDLELFENQFNILESMVFTIAICITFFMAIFVHRAFYRLMKRLPGRDINQIICPYMVK